MYREIIADTNAIIALIDGCAEVAAIFSSAATVAIPSIVCGEILAGAQGETRREMKTRQFFEVLMSAENCIIHPVSLETAMNYALIASVLKKTGKPIPKNDMWIAAIAMESNGILLTNDSHFSQLPLIRTMSYGDWPI